MEDKKTAWGGKPNHNDGGIPFFDKKIKYKPSEASMKAREELAKETSKMTSHLKEHEQPYWGKGK